MKRFKGTKGMILIMIMAVLIIGYYYYLSNRNVPKPEEEVAEELSKTQEALMRNLDTNYPPTPREVVKYFGQITECFYNEDNTEEEVYELGMKIRQLYDKELAANQTEEEYIEALKADVASYKEQNQTISSYAPSSSVDVETFSQDGYEWARLYCIFSIKKDQLLYNSNLVFMLRKDENSHYKIYGWKLVKNDQEQE